MDEEKGVDGFERDSTSVKTEREDGEVACVEGEEDGAADAFAVEAHGEGRSGLVCERGVAMDLTRRGGLCAEG